MIWPFKRKEPEIEKRSAAAGFTSLSGCRIHWLQQSSKPEEPPPAAVRKVREQLQGQGNTVDVHLFNSPAFWQLVICVVTCSRIHPTTLSRR